MTILTIFRCTVQWGHTVVQSSIPRTLLSHHSEILYPFNSNFPLPSPQPLLSTILLVICQGHRMEFYNTKSNMFLLYDNSSMTTCKRVEKYFLHYIKKKKVKVV